MSIFSKKATSVRRRAPRKQSQRNRHLRLESLEGRRLMSADVTHLMASGHHDDGEHAGGVIVTESAILTHHDAIPRFGANPTQIAIADGLWSDARVWSSGKVPGADDVVSIPSGVAVTYDVDTQLELDVVEVSGRLDFATDVDTSLWLNELMVMPSGVLSIGTESDPVSASVTAEIVITDTPGAGGLHYKTGTVEQPGIDPNQWGNGILGFGTIDVHGQEKTSSYIRLAEEPLAGDRVLVLESEPEGWQAGDKLVLPDTSSSWKGSRIEELVVESVDGNRVTLTQPLTHDHRGPRASADGAPIVLPHIGNLTRNVVIRSENPDGVRGHVAFMSQADIDVNHASFKDLGRTTSKQSKDWAKFDSDGQVTKIATNQIARYAMHFHHVTGPHNPEDTGYQFEVNGNAVDGAKRWGIVVHGSHYGLIKDNIVYDYEGAAFVTEDGTESYNVFEGNFAVRSNGDGKSFKSGDAGEGFWFRGPLTTAVDNVSANSQRAGFVHFAQNLHGLNQNRWPKPAFRGADMSVESQVIRYNVFQTPILQFEGNEAYASASVFDSWMNIPDERQFLSGTTGWNTSDNNFAISSYNNRNLVLEDLTLLGDLTRLNSSKAQKHQPISALGIEAVRASESITILNSEIRGVQVGFETPAFAPDEVGSKAPHEMLIADSVFQAYTGILVNTMTRSKSSGKEADYARLVIENTRFERMPENRVDPDQYAIDMRFNLNTDVTKTNEVFLYDFNGVPGANFQVYYPEQAPNFIVPHNAKYGSPEAGLTNAQTWERYGIAIGGAVAPTLEHDGDNGEAALARGRALGIRGLVFPLKGDANLNQAPVVNAGVELTVDQFRQVSLVGQVTDDGLTTGAASGVAHTDWSKQSGPGEVLFVDTESVNTLATFTEPGIYIMRLTASDGLRESYSDITVTVVAASNRAPVVNAGASLVLNDSNITHLRGTVSDDGNPGGVLETQWSVVSGPGTVNFANPHSPTTEAVFTAKGTYVLELQASDGELVSSGFTEVTVNVAFPQSPLLVHLEMNGAQASDSSVHELHGSAVNVIGSETTSGSGLTFSGDSHVAMPRTDFLQPRYGLTTALWIRPSVADGIQRPVLVWDGGSWDAYSITVANSANGASISAGVATSGNKTINVRTESFPADQWTHLALTYNQENGGEVRLYRNGQLIGTRQGIGGPLSYMPHADKRLTLGKENPNSTAPGFIGAMNDLYVYDYALNAEELMHLMMGHAPHSETPTTPPPHHTPHMHSVMSIASGEPQANVTEDVLTADLLHTLLVDSPKTRDDAYAHGGDHSDPSIPEVRSGDDESSDPWCASIDVLLTAELELSDWTLTI